MCAKAEIARIGGERFIKEEDTATGLSNWLPDDDLALIWRSP